MTAPTHRQYAVLFACITVILLYQTDVFHVNYYLGLLVMLQFSKAGALFPDVDHTWRNVHDKTVPNKIVNMLIHATGGKHRSWQTHSIDICLVFTLASFLLPKALFEAGTITDLNKEVLSLILVGFASGWVSHMFSDMLNGAGVRITCLSKRKIAFVPKKLFGFKFNTGDAWEAFNFKAVKFINIFVGMACLVYPIIKQYI